MKIKKVLIFIVVSLTMVYFTLNLDISKANELEFQLLLDGQSISYEVKNGAIMFSDNEDYKFDNVPENLLGAKYAQTPYNGAALEAVKNGWIYVITPIKGSESQREALLNDGFKEEQMTFMENFIQAYNVRPNTGIGERKPSVYPLGIFSKYVMDGAKITTNSLSIVLSSEEPLNLTDEVNPQGNETVKIMKTGDLIWHDSSEVFSDQVLSVFEGVNFIQGSKTTGMSARAVKNGYMYLLSTSDAHTGYIKLPVTPFPLYEGSDNYNVFGRVFSINDNLTVSVANTVSFFSYDQLIFGESFEVKANLAVASLRDPNVEVAKMEIGAQLWKNRIYALNKIPEYLQGLHYILHSIDTNNASNSYQLDIKESGYVYALANPNGGIRLEDQGFVKKDLMKIIRMYPDQIEETNVYEKYLNVGETVEVDAKWMIPFFANKLELGNDLAKISSLSAPHAIKLEPRVRIFSDRHYFASDIPDALVGKSILQTKYSSGGSYKVETDGVVYMLTQKGSPAAQSLELSGFTLMNFPSFRLVIQNPSDMNNVVVYGKYLTAGTTVSYTRWTVPVFETLSDEAYYVEPAQTPASITNLLVNPDGQYDTQLRHFQGCATIEITPGGRIYYGLFTGGTREPDPDNYGIVLVSDDDGESVIDPYLVIRHEDVRVEDTQLWMDPQGRLWIFWAQSGVMETKELGDVWSNFDHSLGVWAVVIDNPDAPLEELTWSEPVHISDGLMRNKPTVLEDGTWLLSIYDMIDSNRASVYASEDEGNSWELRGTVYAQGSTSENLGNSVFDEHMIVEKNDGSLWMLMRADYGISESYSYDGGYTWSSAVDSGLPGGNSRFYFARLESGNLLLVTHDNPTGAVTRSHLTALLSTNDGKTWDHKLLLDEANEISYPDAVQIANGDIWVVYDRGRTSHKELLQTIFTEQDIIDGAFNSENSTQKEIISKVYDPVEIDSISISDGESPTYINANLKGRKFISLTGVDVPISEADYQYQNNTILIKADYIKQLEPGTYQYVLVVDMEPYDIEEYIINLKVENIEEEGSIIDFDLDDEAKFKYVPAPGYLASDVFKYVTDGGKAVLKLNSDGTNWPIHSAYLNNAIYRDVIVEARMKRLDSQSGFPLLFVRRTNTDGNHEQTGGGFSVGIQNNGQLTVYAKDSSYPVIEYQLPNDIYQDGEYYTIKVRAEGNRYAIYVNDHYIQTYVDTNRIISDFGYIGVVSSNADAYVDSLSIQVIAEADKYLHETTIEYTFDSESELNDFTSYFTANGLDAIKDSAISNHWLIKNGVLQRVNDINLAGGTTTNYASLLFKEYYLNNYELSVDYKRGSDTSGWAGLASKLRSFGNAGNNSGMLSFVQKEGIVTNWGRAGIGGPTASERINGYDDSSWHNLKVIVVNETAKVLLDGKLYLTIEFTDGNQLLAGFLGLQSTNNNSAYDNLVLTALDANGNPTALKAREDQRKIAIIGDSISFGAELTDEAGNYSLADNYANRLQTILGEEFFIKNFGVSGRTLLSTGDTPFINDPEYIVSQNFKPDVVMIMLGTNDSKSINWLGDSVATLYKADYIALINSYKTINPDVKVILMTSPTTYHEIVPDHIVSGIIVPLQREIATETGSTLVDINLITKNKVELFPDLIHPNKEGHNLIAEDVSNYVISEFINNFEITNPDIIFKVNEKGSINLDLDLDISLLPELVWSSSNSDIVTVDKYGIITAKSVGTATITVTAGNKTQSALITINKDTPVVEAVVSQDDQLIVGDFLPNLDANTSVPGTIELDSGQSLIVGTNSYTWTFTPEDLTNYEIVTGTIELTVNKITTEIHVEVTNKEYDGKEPVINISTNAKNYTIEYYEGNTLLESAPINAGSYKVVITVAESDNFTQASISKNFTISKVVPKIDNLKYIGNPLYTSSDLPVGEDFSFDTTAGEFILNEGQVLVIGEVEYTWTFIPSDQKNYETITGKIKLTVKEVVLESITVTPPTKVVYQKGDMFDKKGMIVYGNYNDGSTVVITDYKVDKAKLGVKDDIVTVSYGGFTKEIEITVEAKGLSTGMKITISAIIVALAGSSIGLGIWMKKRN
mgnify:CR=1 FL=1